MMSVADESATRAIGIAGSSSEPAVFESAGSAGGSVSEIVRPKDVVVEEEQEAEPVSAKLPQLHWQICCCAVLGKHDWGSGIVNTIIMQYQHYE